MLRFAEFICVCVVVVAGLVLLLYFQGTWADPVITWFTGYLGTFK